MSISNKNMVHLIFTSILRHEPELIISSITLLLLGLVMMASASINLAQIHFNDPLHFFGYQLAYASLGIILAILTTLVPVSIWQRFSALLLLLFSWLILVLIPGVGHEVNGSKRWITVAVFRFQPSELGC